MFNSIERAKYKDGTFERDFYKLLNNAVYGISMMNVRKFNDSELVSKVTRFDKLVRSNRLKSINIFNEDLVLVNRYKKTVQLNKPIYTGFSILEHSKLHMQKFYYDVLKKRYGNKISLCMTDTDSFIFYVETEDLYKDMYEMKDEYDLANFPENHFLYKQRKEDFDSIDSNHLLSKEDYTDKFKEFLNNAVIGKFKDETKGYPIYEFIGLQSKTYSLTIGNEQTQKNTAKGVKYSVKKQELKHNIYHNVRNNENIHQVQQCLFKTEKHEIYTTMIKKNGLSCFDDKRYVLNKNESLPYGHYKINQL